MTAPRPVPASKTSSREPAFDPSTLVGVRLKVTAGCLALGIRKGGRWTVVSAEYVLDHGYRLRLKCAGRQSGVLWAASSARLKDNTLSLNDGNPLHRVQFERVSPVLVTLKSPSEPAVDPRTLGDAERLEAALASYNALGSARPSPQTKARQKEGLALAKRFCRVIREVGGVSDPTEVERWPSFLLLTRYGVLGLSVDVNHVSEGATVFSRFREKIDGKFPSLRECNPYSGKWNHHYFVSEQFHDIAEKELRERLSAILPQDLPVREQDL